ncbi:MAG: hypothetical protein AAGF28_01985 [Pseudomonadota bacterium]
MFTQIIKSTLIAATIAGGALVASSQSASAHHVSGGIFFDGSGIHFGIGDRGFGKRRHFDRGYGHRRTCRPGKAVRKARNRGVRRARIVRVNRRGVVVAGRKWGERVIIGFGKHRSCPVRFVRAR